MNPVLARFLRAAVAVVVAGVVETYGDSPYYLVIAPLLMAFGKWLRDRYGIDWVPV